jgi:MFS transporter, AAHS family, 4-hydroxybenzoate transporter
MLNASGTQGSALDVRRFIDEQPVSTYQWSVAAMCALVVFVDGFDAQAMGFVGVALSADLDVPRSVLGPVISSGLVGMLVGALVFGTLADRIGRKPVLIASTFVFGLGSLLTATADSVTTLSIYRVLTGLGMGGAMPNAIALTSEFMPARLRATAVTAMMCGFSLGAAVGGFVAAGLIPRFGWQSVFVAGGVTPLVIGTVVAVLLPESIRFLLARDTEHARVRRYLAQIAPHARIPEALVAGGAPPADDLPVIGLFTEGRAVVTLLIWVVYFTNLLVLYFLNSWLPTIMSDSGIDSATAIRVTALFQVGGCIGAILVGRLLDRRRSFGLLAACFIWAAIWIIVTAEAGTSVPLLITAMLAVGVGVIGGQNAGHALSSAFYPTAMRATGVGWALGIGRIGSIAGPMIGGILLSRAGGSPRQVLWAAAIPAVIAALAALTIKLMPVGRTQESNA